MWGQTGRSLIIYRVDGRGFKRPSGTRIFSFCLPGVETPGYFHLSLRDMRLGWAIHPFPKVVGNLEAVVPVSPAVFS
jgi:hypothetical protein